MDRKINRGDFTVEQIKLTNFVGTVTPKLMQEICRAMNIALGCMP